MDLIGVAPRLPEPGETVMGNHFYTAPGGKGANQAVAAARMGAHVKMVGRVGDDVFGPPMLDDLEGYGIDTSGISVDPDHASGIAMILLDDQRQNYIVAIYGANMQCGERELAAVESALEGADALMLQLETPYEVSLRAARMANEMGVTVVWDPAPPLGLPPEAFAALDVVTPNQTEAEALTGIPVSNVESAHAAADALLEAGTSIAIVKLGEGGACCASPEGRGHVRLAPTSTPPTPWPRETPSAARSPWPSPRAAAWPRPSDTAPPPGPSQSQSPEPRRPCPPAPRSRRYWPGEGLPMCYALRRRKRNPAEPVSAAMALASLRGMDS